MSDPGPPQAEPSLGQRVGRILIGPDELAQDQDSPGQGVSEVRSGFAISGPHVLTAWHCTAKDPQAPLWFRLRDPGTSHGYHYVPVLVTSFDAGLDVAVLSVDPARLAAELTEADAAGVLARAAIPIAAGLPESAQVKVMGFSQSKYTFDGDTYEATIREPAVMQSGIRCMKLYGQAFDSQQPVSVDGLSGGPVLKAVSRGQGRAPDYVAVGIVRLSLVSVRVAEAAASGAAYPDGTLGGEFLATRLADVTGLPEIVETLRADLPRTHRTPDYRRVIERRASKELLGRRAELAALADFARPGSARPPYAIWTGIAGAGKSLLAAHFALRPPPGVDVVAFFVSRYPPQQSQDFLRDACDQLAALLDTVAPSAPDLNRFTALWEDAGAAAAARGRTLLLLIDGLDEEDDPPWIDSSLPRDGDATRRVAVFTTASAQGADRDFGLPAGQVARHEVVKSDPPREAAHDIIAAVEGDLPDLMQNVLGLMAAAESPLSARDITRVLHDEGLLEPSAKNVGALVRMVKKALEDASSLGLVAPTLEDAGLYQFEFGVGKLVTQELADALDGHREQITTWADEYAAEGWPQNTPRYLLTGYPRMLHHVGDSPRLLALTTPSRIKALREATGDETAALDELSLVLGHLATAEVPDVAMACRTVLRREQILRAMAWYPLPLIPAKATLGEWAAAHQLASHLEKPEQQAEALTMVGYAATDAGKGQVGHDLLVEALRAVARITQPYWRMYASRAVAQTALRAEWLIEPQTVGVAFTDPRAGAIALAAFADAARGARRWGDAVDFLTEAYRIAASADGEPAPGAGGPVPEAPGAPSLPGMVIGQTALAVAGAAAMAGDSDSAIKAAILIPGLADRVNSLANAYLLSAAAGQPAGQVISALLGLREPATRVENHGERAFVLATLARALTACGHPVSDLLDAAESAADDTARAEVDPAFFATGGPILPGLQPPAAAQAESFRLGASTRAYACVATAAVFCGQPADERLARAREFAAQWKAVAWRPDEQDLWSWIVVAIGAAMAAADPQAAREALEAAFTDPGPRVAGLTAVVPAAAIARQPTDGLLAGARDAAGRAGDGTQAAMQLIEQAEDAAADVARMLSGLAGIADPARREAIGTLIRLSVADSNIIEPFQRAGVLSTIAAGIAIAGGVADETFRAARAATARIADPGQRLVVQINACQAAIGASCFGAAADIAVGLEDRGQRPLVLASAASAAASAGQPAGELIEKARQAAMDAGELGNRPWLLTTVANAAITAGCLAAAERIADDVDEPSQRAGILAAAARAAAKAASSGPGTDGSAAVSAGSSAAELIEKAQGIAKDIRDPAQQAWATGGIIAAALATGDNDLARRLATEASQDAMEPDPGIRATLLGVLARVADDRPAVAASLFREACRATDFEGFLRRAYAIAELSAQAAGRAEWPDFLRAEVDRAVLIPGEYERTQALGTLAQAAGQSGDSRLAQYAAGQIPDPGAKVLALVNVGYAVRQDPAAADACFGLAYQAAGLPFSRTIDWAPAAIAQTAAASLRTGIALSAAQQIPSSDQRRAALVTVNAVLRMAGPEPVDYSPPVVSDDWRAVLVQAAYTVGWFGVAASLADGIEDLNYRAYLLLGLAEAAAKAGQPGHASAAARAVLDLKGRIDRSMAGRALAIVVNQADNQAQACRDLVAGMTVCFHPDLFAIAQRLAPDTLRILVRELGIELAVS